MFKSFVVTTIILLALMAMHVGNSVRISGGYMNEETLNNGKIDCWSVYANRGKPSFVRIIDNEYDYRRIIIRGYVESPDNGSTVLDNQSLRLSITWDNNTNIISVDIRYSYDKNNWSEWITANYDSVEDYFYIDIDDAEWKTHIGGNLYWEVNRTYVQNDSTTWEVIKTFVVHLGDDDPDPPYIYGAEVLEGISGDGSPETDAPFFIALKLRDKSGVKNVSVEYNASGYIGTLSASLVNQSVDTYVYRTETFGPVPGGDLAVTIEAYDSDDDGWNGDSLRGRESFTFHIEREDVNVDMHPYELYINYTERGYLLVRMTRDDGGIELDGLEIRLLIFQEEGVYLYNRTNVTSDGETSFSISPSELGLKPGQYYMRVEFDGDEYFSPASNESWLHVRIETTVSINMDTDVKYGQLVRIETYLWQNDENGTPLSYKPIEIYCNVSGELVFVGRNYTDAEGLAILYWRVNVSSGVFIFIARYIGDQHHYGSSDSVSVTIHRSDISIVFEDSYSIVYSDGGVISAYVVDEFGNRVDGVNISIYVISDGHEILLGYNITSNGDLVVVISRVSGFPPPDSLMPGDYTCEFRFDGDQNYFGTTNNTLLTIIRENLEDVFINLNTSTVEWGDGLSIDVYAVDDDGEGMKSGNITIYLIQNGTIILSDMICVDDGHALLDIAVYFDVHTNITVNVTIYSDAYNISNTCIHSSWFVIVPEEVIATVNVTDDVWRVKYGLDSSITISLVDNDGRRLTLNGSILLNITWGRMYVLYSIDFENSCAMLHYPFSFEIPTGTYEVRLVNMSTEEYVFASEYKISLEVDKLLTMANIIEYDLRYGDEGKVVIEILDEAYRPVPNTLVVIRIGTLEAEGITDENGVATIACIVELTPGNYTLQAGWGGSDVYVGGDKSFLVVVKKERLSVRIEVSGRLIVWEDAYINITITDDEGLDVYGFQILVYADDNLLYNGTYDGPMTIRWTPSKSGEVVIRVEVLENDYYEGISYEKRVHVEEKKEALGSMLYVFVSIATIAVIVTIIIALRRIKAGRS